MRNSEMPVEIEAKHEAGRDASQASPAGAPADTGVLEGELARLIVDVLQLETPAGEIDPEAPLFGDGLGLDSIDALEMALAISQRYGVEIKSEDERNRHIFASLRSLAQFIAAARTR